MSKIIFLKKNYFYAFINKKTLWKAITTTNLPHQTYLRQNIYIYIYIDTHTHTQLHVTIVKEL